MSDILIKCMEMPKRMPIKAIIFQDGRVTVTLHSGKSLECKAVPVPPHGRLIDADALIKVLKTKAKHPLNIETTPYSWAFAYECLADVVGDMPTIIPAEEGE